MLRSFRAELEPSIPVHGGCQEQRSHRGADLGGVCKVGQDRSEGLWHYAVMA